MSGKFTIDQKKHIEVFALFIVTAKLEKIFLNVCILQTFED